MGSHSLKKTRCDGGNGGNHGNPGGGGKASGYHYERVASFTHSKEKMRHGYTVEPVSQDQTLSRGANGDT